MPRDNPDIRWTSEDDGWLLTFTTLPDGFEELPVGRGPGTTSEAMDQHFEKCCEQLAGMLEEGVRITDRAQAVNIVTIVGEQEACERLKQRVKESGFATMEKNQDWASLA